jgi:hypothetical protein
MRGMDWSNLSKEGDQWRAVVNTAIKNWVPQKMRNFCLANRTSQRRCFSMELR